MKRLLVGIISVALVAGLVACSPAATGATSAPSSTEGAASVAPNGTPGPGGFQQSPTMQLLLGTFALEDTDNAVTAEQAKAMLPLWQALLSLSNSDSTAPEELTAVEAQLRAAYTAGQITALEALTPEDLQQVMADQGLDFGRGALNGTQPAGGNGNGFPDGGGPPPGGFPDGGPGGGGAGGFDPSNLSPEQQATFDARGANGGFGGRGGVPAPLLQAVIELLTTRAQN